MNHYSQFTGEELSFKWIKQFACGYTMMELEFKPRFFFIPEVMFPFKLLSKWLNAHIMRNVEVTNIKYKCVQGHLFPSSPMPITIFLGEKYMFGNLAPVSSYFITSKSFLQISLFPDLQIV